MIFRTHLCCLWFFSLLSSPSWLQIFLYCLPPNTDVFSRTTFPIKHHVHHYLSTLVPPLYYQQHKVNQSMAMQFIQMGESWLITRCVLGDQFSLLTRRGCESILFFSLAAFGGSPVHTACPFFLFSSLSSLFFQLTRDFTFKQPAQVNILSLSLENNHSSNHNYKWVSRLLPPILSLSLFPLCRYSRTQQCTTIYPIVEMANNWLTLNLVIAAQRRGRNGYGSRKRQRQVIPQPQPSQSTSEEESTDGGSVTRCVCGESRKCE